MTVDRALEHISDIGVWLDLIELRGFDQRYNRGPTLRAAIAAGEQMILAAERDRPDCPLDRIGVELDAAVIKEPGESGPAGKRIADRLGEYTPRQECSD